MTYTAHFNDGHEISGYVNDVEDLEILEDEDVNWLIATSDDWQEVWEWTKIDNWQSIIEDGECTLF